MQLIRHIFSKNTKKAELSTAPPFVRAIYFTALPARPSTWRLS